MQSVPLVDSSQHKEYQHELFHSVLRKSNLETIKEETNSLDSTWEGALDGEQSQVPLEDLQLEPELCREPAFHSNTDSASLLHSPCEGFTRVACQTENEDSSSETNSTPKYELRERILFLENECELQRQEYEEDKQFRQLELECLREEHLQSQDFTLQNILLEENEQLRAEMVKKDVMIADLKKQLSVYQQNTAELCKMDVPQTLQTVNCKLQEILSEQNSVLGSLRESLLKLEGEHSRCYEILAGRDCMIDHLQQQLSSNRKISKSTTAVLSHSEELCSRQTKIASEGLDFVENDTHGLFPVSAVQDNIPVVKKEKLGHSGPLLKKDKYGQKLSHLLLSQEKELGDWIELDANQVLKIQHLEQETIFQGLEEHQQEALGASKEGIEDLATSKMSAQVNKNVVQHNCSTEATPRNAIQQAEWYQNIIFNIFHTVTTIWQDLENLRKEMSESSLDDVQDCSMFSNCNSSISKCNSRVKLPVKESDCNSSKSTVINSLQGDRSMDCCLKHALELVVTKIFKKQIQLPEAKQDRESMQDEISIHNHCIELLRQQIGVLNECVEEIKLYRRCLANELAHLDLTCDLESLRKYKLNELCSTLNSCIMRKGKGVICYLESHYMQTTRNHVQVLEEVMKSLSSIVTTLEAEKKRFVKVGGCGVFQSELESEPFMKGEVNILTSKLEGSKGVETLSIEIHHLMDLVPQLDLDHAGSILGMIIKNVNFTCNLGEEIETLKSWYVEVIRKNNSLSKLVEYLEMDAQEKADKSRELMCSNKAQEEKLKELTRDNNLFLEEQLQEVGFRCTTIENQDKNLNISLKEKTALCDQLQRKLKELQTENEALQVSFEDQAHIVETVKQELELLKNSNLNISDTEDNLLPKSQQLEKLKIMMFELHRNMLSVLDENVDPDCELVDGISLLVQKLQKYIGKTKQRREYLNENGTQCNNSKNCAGCLQPDMVEKIAETDESFNNISDLKCVKNKYTQESKSAYRVAKMEQDQAPLKGDFKARSPGMSPICSNTQKTSKSECLSEYSSGSCYFHDQPIKTEIEIEIHCEQSACIVDTSSVIDSERPDIIQKFSSHLQQKVETIQEEMENTIVQPKKLQQQMLQESKNEYLDRTKLESEFHSLNKKVKRLLANHKKVKRVLDQQRKELKAAQKLKAHSEWQCLQIKEEAVCLKKQIERLSAEKEEYARCAEILKKETENLNYNMKRLEYLGKLEFKIQELFACVPETEFTHYGFECGIDIIIEKINSYRNKLENSLSPCMAVKRQVRNSEKMKRVCMDLEEKIDHLQDCQRLLKSTLLERNSVIEGLQTDKAQLLKEIKGLNEKLQVTEQYLAHCGYRQVGNFLICHCSRFHPEVKDLQLCVKELEERVSDVSLELKQRNAEIESVSNLISHLNKTKNEYKWKCCQLQSEMLRLEHQTYNRPVLLNYQ